MVTFLFVLHFGLAAVAIVSGVIDVIGQVRGQMERRWSVAFLISAAAAAACNFVPFKGFTFAVGLGIVILLAIGAVLVAQRSQAFGDGYIAEIAGSAVVLFLLAVGSMVMIPSSQPFLRDKDLWMSLGTGAMLMLMQLFFIDLLIKRHEEQRVALNWAAANREFLASCIQIGWSVSNAASVILCESEDKGSSLPKERRLLLSRDAEIALTEVMEKSQAYHSALQVAEPGFGDEERAKLATVAFSLRAAGSEASSALRRYQRIERELPVLSAISPSSLNKHLARGYDVEIPIETSERDRSLLVSNIGELSVHASAASRKLRDFAIQRESIDGLSETDIYRMLVRRYDGISVGSDIDMIDRLTNSLVQRRKRIEVEGICLVVADVVAGVERRCGES